MRGQLKIDYVDPNLLKPNAFNSNVVSPENEDKIDASVERFGGVAPGGLFKPILVRTLDDGTLEILGGEHRTRSAQRKGVDSVPIINLGRLDDAKAKEIGLVDNGRYGTDDAWKLAEVLNSLGGHEDVLSFMPFSDVELEAVLSSTSIDIDDLGIGDEDEDDTTPSEPQTKFQTHQMMRFKVPKEDADDVQRAIERVMKEQGYTEADSLTNAGDALVHLVRDLEGKS